MKETRINSNKESVSIRSDENGGYTVEGWASVFNHRSRLIAEGGKVFYETINPQAFDEVLRSDNLNVIANFQHKDENMLARTKSGTLALEVDDYGLRYSFVPPNTSLGNDIVEWLQRGDITESSFRFSVKPSDIVWGRAEDGILTREIMKVSGLYDVALVLTGAFSNTDVSLRGLDEFEAKEAEERKKRKQELADYYKQLEERI